MRLPSDELNAQLVSFSQNLEAILVRLGGIVESVARQYCASQLVCLKL